LARKEIDINKEYKGCTPLMIAQSKIAQAQGNKFTKIVALLQQHNSAP